MQGNNECQTYVCHADQDLQWLSAHDPCDINNISDGGVATVKLDKDVCCVGRQNSHGNDWNWSTLTQSLDEET